MLFLREINFEEPSKDLYILDFLMLCISLQSKKSRCLELNNGKFVK
jgi:hypothetical protein